MKVVKNFLYNISYQLLTIILPLITVPYVSNILGAEGIGDYAFTFANTQYFVLFGMIGVTLYGNRQIAYVRDDKEKLKNNFYSIYSLQLITTLISLVMFLVFSIVLNKGMYRILYLAQGLNILAAIFDISWLFMGLEEFKKTVIRNTIVKLASLASIFLFVKTNEDLYIYVIILGASSLIGNLTFWMYIPKMIGLKNIKVNNLKIHLRASFALFIPQIAIQVYVLLDRTILGILTDNIQVGYYENSQKLIKIALTIATAVGTVMMPKISNTVAKGDMEKVKFYIKNSFFFVSGISIPLTFGLMAVAPKLSTWFFTDKFKGIETLIIITSVIIIIISWSNVIGTQLLVPLNKTKEFTISVTAGAIVNLILNLVIIKKFGAVGACISTVVAESIVTATQFYYVRKFLNISELIKPILSFIPPAILMYICVSFIGNYMSSNIVTTIVQGICGIVIYFGGVEVIFRMIYKSGVVKYTKNKLIN